MMTFESIKKDFDHDRELYRTGHATPINPRLKGAAIGLLTAAAGGKYNRHRVQQALTGHSHGGDFDQDDWYAMMQLVDPQKIGDEWTASEDLFEAVQVILSHLDNEEAMKTRFLGF